ncbi:MAG: protein translocase subunit SecF [Thioalkalivibrionaceae bacterium]
MLRHIHFHDAGIDFLGWRRLAIGLSLVLMVISIALIAARGLNFGVDFTGGTLVEVGYPEAVELDPIRQTLADNGFERATVQTFGTARDVLIRLPPLPADQLGEEGAEAEVSNLVMRALQAGGPEGVELRRVEFVGPAVGEELREQGGLAMVYALIGILIYVAVRFEWRFSVGSVAALVHDVVITLGVFALTGLEFDMGVLAAILAVIGYSLNDTIVVYDRIRENFRVQRKAGTLDVMNDAINKTLSRTIITGLTTLLVLLALAFFGGATLFGFAVALIVGVVVGTYSSIFVAAAVAYMLGVDRQVLLPVKKEGADEDSAP